MVALFFYFVNFPVRAVTDLVCVDVRRHGFGEEVRRHSSSLEVEVQSSRVLIGHCKQKQNQGVVTRTDRELVVQYLTHLDPGCNEKKKRIFTKVDVSLCDEPRLVVGVQGERVGHQLFDRHSHGLHVHRLDALI